MFFTFHFFLFDFSSFFHVFLLFINFYFPFYACFHSLEEGYIFHFFAEPHLAGPQHFLAGDGKMPHSAPTLLEIRGDFGD